jgi:hypothetical protein
MTFIVRKVFLRVGGAPSLLLTLVMFKFINYCPIQMLGFWGFGAIINEFKHNQGEQQ